MPFSLRVEGAGCRQRSVTIVDGSRDPG